MKSVLNQYDAAAAAVIFSTDCITKVGSSLAELWESVLGGSMTSRLLQQTLAELLAKRPQTAEERTAIDAAIAAVVRGMQAADPMPADAPLPQDVAVSPFIPVKTSLPRTSVYYGLGLREAGPKRLSLLPPKTAQTARQIWEALAAEGYESAHRDPPHAMNDAMRRRAKTHNDVLLVGEGKWGLKSWYTEEDLEQIKKSMGGMGGRDKVEHIAATKRGMLVAISRGAVVGGRAKLDAEKIAKIEEMIRSGISITKIAEAFDVTRATIHNNIPRERVNALREEAKRRRPGNMPPEGVRH